MKKCNKCGVEKPPEAFGPSKQMGDGLYPNCRICHAARSRDYYVKNKIGVGAKRLELRRGGGEKLRRWFRDYEKKRRRECPGFKLCHNLRTRISKCLRGLIKSGGTLELLGCNIPELRAHLEKQFRPGMTWENYGPVWHVDHARPCASFDLTDPVQQRECFHFSNLQPLFVSENLQKGAKFRLTI